MTKNEKHVESVTGYVAKELLSQLNGDIVAKHLADKLGTSQPTSTVEKSCRAVENELRKLKGAVHLAPVSRELIFEQAAAVAVAALRLMIDACL